MFISACEVGRSTPALVGVGGVAKAFVDLGASALIAPLWSVKDSFAPPRLSRDLLIRSIAYRMQELVHGGLSKASQRTLATLSKEFEPVSSYRSPLIYV